jgi:hypothetical protein
MRQPDKHGMKKPKDITMSHVWSTLDDDVRLTKKHYRGGDKPLPDKKLPSRPTRKKGSPSP